MGVMSRLCVLSALGGLAAASQAGVVGTTQTKYNGLGLSHSVSVTGYSGTGGHMKHGPFSNGTGEGVALNGVAERLLFCLEFQTVQSGTFTFDIRDIASAPAPTGGSPYGSTKEAKAHAVIYAAIYSLGWIKYNLSGTGLLNGDRAGAIQVFVWEAVREADGNAIDHAAGSFASSGQSGTYATALNDLRTAAQAAYAAGKTVAGLYAMTNNSTQDMLITIPLPAGAAMAGLPLFGLAAIRRRRA